MVTITLHCHHCQSNALVRNGHAPNGKQLYRCRACGRQSRENPTPYVYPEARREEILHAFGRSRSERCDFYHTGTGSTVVLRAQKSEPSLGMDSAVSQNTSSSGLCA